MSDMGPVELPWSYWDGAVGVELRAHEYPYGAGSVGSGVQISLSSRHTGQVIAVRLPGNSAMRLALAILGATTPHPPPIEDDPVAKRLGIVPCCGSHNVHCEPPSELCCRYCTEVGHPDHPPGVRCVLPQAGPSGGIIP